MLTRKPAKSPPRDEQGRGQPLPTPDPLDDLFHHCALWAWAEIYEETGQWPPDSEQTRRRAYDLYETEKRKESAK
jgi:hypothetical protein